MTVLGPTPVDLLIVVDDSPAMANVRTKVRTDLDSLVRALLTGDANADGVADWPSVPDLRVGFVTPDLGVQGIGTNGEPPVAGCGADSSMVGGVDVERARYGDDAVLRRQQVTQYVIPGDASSGVSVDCDVDGTPGDDLVPIGDVPTYLSFSRAPGAGSPDASTVDELSRRGLCLGSPGASGCGFTQPLEAVLKAITPSAATSSLVGGAFYAAATETSRSLGRGDDVGSNAGWLRDDSLLAVLVVSAGDDCSASTPVVYDASSTQAGYGDAYGAFQQATRCARHADDLRPVDRFVQGLLARRVNARSQIYFGVLGGLPPQSATGISGPFAADLQSLLSDAAMQTVFEPRDLPAGPGGSIVTVPDAALAPACSHLDVVTAMPDFSATPSRRLVEAAASLRQAGAFTQVESLCSDAAIGSIASALMSLIQYNTSGMCLPRPFPRNLTGRIDCEVRVTLPPNTTCANTPGAGFDPDSLVPTSDTEDTDGQLERCRLAQVPISQADIVSGFAPAWGSGWFYDDYTAEISSCGSFMQRMSFTPGATPPGGSVIDVDCLRPTLNASLAIDRNTECAFGQPCVFPTAADAQAFVSFYDLPATFDPGTDLVCSAPTLTCQIACETDADCPSGESCLAPLDLSLPDGPSICVNPACVP